MKTKILLARENKMKIVKEFFNHYENDSLIMIKANIPGINKNIPLASYLIKIFLNDLSNYYHFFFIKHYESFDGPYYLCGLQGKDINIKKTLITLENSHSLGRFIDLDYFIYSDKSLTRDALGCGLRRCLLCDNEAIVCMRKNTHTTEELLAYMEKETVEFFSDVVVDLASFAIVRELKIPDKFGLVSFVSNGTHLDMDYSIMLKGQEAILPYFKEMFIKGYLCSDLTLLLDSVRADGIKAEKEMFKATNGINCYKGVIFLLGLALLSFGYTMKTSKDFQDIFINIAKISANIFEDFQKDYKTFGVKLYRQQGITGVRGIAKSGFKIIHDNLDMISIYANDNQLRALLHHFIINSNDTVFIKRAKTFSNYLNYKNIFKQHNPNNQEDLLFLNKFSLDNNLSFGGSADLLIVAIFMVHLRELFI